MSRPLQLNQLLVGDALRELRTLPTGSVDAVLTSPPYFQLRNYGVGGQLGTEPTVDGWVADLHRVARELHRVLTPTGTLWLNLGDTYATHSRQGAARKGLLLGPERLALALIQDGWIMRNKIVWSKPNPLPTSVRDRLMARYEYVYVFAKQPSYYFDLDAIREPHSSQAAARVVAPAVDRTDSWRGANAAPLRGLDRLKASGHVGHPLGKNPGDVWSIASSHQGGDHHATFPLQLAERVIRVACPEQRCTRCLRPFTRVTIRALGGTAVRSNLNAGCDCDAGSRPGVVLDPFMGSGTTAVAAERLGRQWLGIELNSAYAAQAGARVAAARPPNRAAA